MKNDKTSGNYGISMSIRGSVVGVRFGIHIMERRRQSVSDTEMLVSDVEVASANLEFVAKRFVRPIFEPTLPTEARTDHDLSSGHNWRVPGNGSEN